MGRGGAAPLAPLWTGRHWMYHPNTFCNQSPFPIKMTTVVPLSAHCGVVPELWLFIVKHINNVIHYEVMAECQFSFRVDFSE